MKLYTALLIMGILTQNFVLSRLLGVDPFINGSDSVRNALKTGLPLIPVMVIASAITYPVNILSEKTELEYLKTPVFILVTVAVIAVLDILLKKISVNTEKQIKTFLPLVTTNCAVLGIVLLNAENTAVFSAQGFGFFHAIVFAFACGVGFTAATVLLAAVRSRIETAPVPKALQGTPIFLVCASIVSLCFSGLSGIVEGLGLIG